MSVIEPNVACSQTRQMTGERCCDDQQQAEASYLPFFCVVATFFSLSANTSPRLPKLRGPRSCLGDRKSTRLNSSHVEISYAVFCLKKKRSSFSCFLTSHTSSTVHLRCHC